MEKLDFYLVDLDYINFLKKAETDKRGFTRVPDTNYGNEKFPKFFAGVVAEINGCNYYVPASHVIDPHRESLVLLDKKGSPIGSLRFNFMVPIPDGCFRKYQIDAIVDRKYKPLVGQEYRYAVNNSEIVYHKAIDTYRRVIKGYNPKLVENACDFRLLEEKYKEWETIQNSQDLVRDNRAEILTYASTDSRVVMMFHSDGKDYVYDWKADPVDAQKYNVRVAEVMDVVALTSKFDTYEDFYNKHGIPETQEQYQKLRGIAEGMIMGSDIKLKSKAGYEQRKHDVFQWLSDEGHFQLERVKSNVTIHEDLTPDFESITSPSKLNATEGVETLYEDDPNNIDYWMVEDFPHSKKLDANGVIEEIERQIEIRSITDELSDRLVFGGGEELVIESDSIFADQDLPDNIIE